MPVRWRAQALVETAIVLPLVVLLSVGTIGVGRLVYARMGLSAAAREAARAATLAPLPPDGSARRAEKAGSDRGEEVARGFGLAGAVISVDADAFERGSDVEAKASDVVKLLGDRSIRLESTHSERVDRYRGRST